MAFNFHIFCLATAHVRWPSLGEWKRQIFVFESSDYCCLIGIHGATFKFLIKNSWFPDFKGVHLFVTLLYVSCPWKWSSVIQHWINCERYLDHLQTFFIEEVNYLFRKADVPWILSRYIFGFNGSRWKFYSFKCVRSYKRKCEKSFEI